MPSQLYQDLLDIEVGTLEALPIESRSTTPCYPYPNLKPTGRRQMMSLRTIVLENDLIRVTVCIDLGGRILYILDKRTGIEILPKMTALDLVEGGSRGAWLPEGIQWMAEREARANALGPVEFLMIEPEEDDQPATLILHELIAGAGMSLQVTLELPPDSAALRVRLQLMNRLLFRSSIPEKLGFIAPGLVPLSWLCESNGGFFDPNRDAGIVVEYEPQLFTNIEANEGELLFQSGSFKLQLSAREVKRSTFTIAPFSGLDGFSAASHGIVGRVSSTRLKLLADEDFQGTLFLLTEHGQTLEAPINLEANQISQTKLPEGSAILSIALRGANKSIEWQWIEEEPTFNINPFSKSATRRTLIQEQFEALTGAIADVRFERHSDNSRSKSESLEGMLRLGRGEFEQGAKCFEDALLYNGEDPLAWYSLALANRLAGNTDEHPALLNAHFLAPLEPLLRAEAFLSQPPSLEKEGSPIVAPIANHPEALVEVTCFLLEAGLRTEAARWIDEALRHGRIASLLYLQAFLMTQSPNLMTEAAQVVQEAEKIPMEPPYPWRQTELYVVARLVNYFPNSARLKRVYEIATT